MGKSNSKSSQTINNNTINQNYINDLNKTIMNSAVETMINNASSCSSAVNLNNSCDMSNTKVGGDFTFNGNQSNNANVNFNCIQANQTSANMASSMIASMISEMKALNGTEAAANLNTASQASNKSGFASMPSNSNSNASTNLTNDVTNETINNIQNIFEQNLSNNFTVNTVNECIAKTNVTNSQDLSNMNIGANAKIECVQTASVEQVQQCKQLSNAIQETTQQTFQELGMTVETQSNNKTNNESVVVSKSENIASGPIQELGDALTNIMGAFGLGFLGPFLIPICSIISIILVVILIVFIAKAFMPSSNNDTNNNTNNNMPNNQNLSQNWMMNENIPYNMSSDDSNNITNWLANNSTNNGPYLTPNSSSNVQLPQYNNI